LGAHYASDALREKSTLSSSKEDRNTTIPFLGNHQAGILTPQQNNSYFASFDLITTKREEVIKLLKDWTHAAANMARGQLANPIREDASPLTADSGDALGLTPSSLTITFGFGAGLFSKNGQDRYNLAKQKPVGLIDMPLFNGDQIVEAISGGDISVQACADDPQVAFHAIRQLNALATDIAQIKWAQTGFMSRPVHNETQRNLMGFKDGTQNPKKQEMDSFVWVGNEGPDWMRGGSYLVTRKIRMALEHWDKVNVGFQEQVIGRAKLSGAPLGMKDEFDALDLAATDKDGNFLIPENAHVRLAAAETNDGMQILRRGYSYNDGVNYVAERWPPWRQGIEYDAGLFFVAYQRDPRTGFVKIFDKMSKFDALNQFTTHISSGLFACPRGAAEGEFIGQSLFDKA